MKRALFLSVALAFNALLGCERRLDRSKLGESAPLQSFPTKDEAALINGKPLRLDQLLAFREKLKRQGSRADARATLSIALTSIHLGGLIAPSDISAEDFIVLSRFTWGDLPWSRARDAALRLSRPLGLNDNEAEARQRLKYLFSMAVVVENPVALQALL